MFCGLNDGVVPTPSARFLLSLGDQMKKNDLCPSCKKGKLIPYPVPVELLEWKVNFPEKDALECPECDCLYPAEEQTK